MTTTASGTARDFRRHLPPGFPPIVCLVGEARFADAFRLAALSETAAGNLVLTAGIGGDVEAHDGRQSALPAAARLKAREAYGELALRKIEISDEVVVINIGRRVGDEARDLVTHARAMGKVVRYLLDVRR